MSDNDASLKPALSHRQMQVLTLLSQGKSNKEIAAELSISYGTVKQHLFTIFKIIGVSNRAKATIIARRMIQSEEGQSVAPTSRARHFGYVVRTVTSVAVVAPGSLPTHVETLALRHVFFNALQELATRLSDAFDGQLMQLPDGGVLLWFGHPVAHVDDADRAVYVAQYLQAWINQQPYVHELRAHARNQTGKPLERAIGIGIASHIEFVANGSEQLRAAACFAIAIQLGQHAALGTHPLSDQLTRKLAALSVPWLAVKAVSQNADSAPKASEHVFALGTAAMPLPDVKDRWGGLPFLHDICSVVESGLAQWASVESWPPAVAASLMDAMGNTCLSQGFTLIRLRLPHSRQRDRLLECLFQQISFSQLKLDFEDIRASMTAGERLATMLIKAANAGPLMLQVYGLQSLDIMRTVLGDKGIARLVGHRIFLVVTNLQALADQQISVRVLGPRPAEAPLTRVHHMQAPSVDDVSLTTRNNLLAVLDNLSSGAYALITQAARQSKQVSFDFLQENHIPRPVLQASIQELLAMGLIAPSVNGGFEFRDLTTVSAIRSLSVDLTEDA